ncbi:uncharacterized protein Bfra_006931 [Botrytis fragariae]|uniref:Uncharacterized protein n=1 Tax=Botrytis fragariae TaxID=1964551 RepID=A0A8H6B5P9_9HELO|nr:uncharacterized protein Bfra_006931 [Botrytis fragariae]KAF5879724.1 hypothetical protein Bfra_006931 [Botrytis fragariae]
MKYTGTVAYYRCYETCGPARWNIFRQAFDKLLLKQWENEVKEGVDPENLRTLWKVRSFQVEEDTSMVALRRTFNDIPTVSEDIWVEDSCWVSGSASSTDSEFIPTSQFFLLIDANVVASIIEGPANGEILFLCVVDPCYGLVEDDGDDGDPEYKGYLKISVEIFGEFWSNVSGGDIFDSEKLGPSDLVKTELFTSALNKDTSKAATFKPQEADRRIVVDHIFQHEILFKFIHTAAGNIKTLQSSSTPLLPTIAPEVWEQFKLEQIVSSVRGKLNNTSHHIQNIIGSHDIPTALFGLGKHIFYMKVLFHSPTIRNFVGKNAWSDLSQQEKVEKLGEMMAVYKNMNYNAAILQQKYANISLELAAFESHAQTQALVDWFRLFVDGM